MKVYIRDFVDAYQHYGNRRSPWVKLPRKLLTVPRFQALDPLSRTAFVGLLLLACDETPLPGGDGLVEGSDRELAVGLGISEDDLGPALAAVEGAGFIQVER